MPAMNWREVNPQSVGAALAAKDLVLFAAKAAPTEPSATPQPSKVNIYSAAATRTSATPPRR